MLSPQQNKFDLNLYKFTKISLFKKFKVQLRVSHNNLYKRTSFGTNYVIDFCNNVKFDTNHPSQDINIVCYFVAMFKRYTERCAIVDYESDLGTLMLMLILKVDEYWRYVFKYVIQKNRFF